MSAKDTGVDPRDPVVEGVCSGSALEPPGVCDSDWQTRVKRAREAREEGRKTREGKPAVFSPVHDPLIRTLP